MLQLIRSEKFFTMEIQAIKTIFKYPISPEALQASTRQKQNAQMSFSGR